MCAISEGSVRERGSEIRKNEKLEMVVVSFGRIFNGASPTTLMMDIAAQDVGHMGQQAVVKEHREDSDRGQLGRC